jgi:hypothetical protein
VPGRLDVGEVGVSVLAAEAVLEGRPAVTICGGGRVWVECRMDILVGRWTLRGGGAMTKELLGLGLERVGLNGLATAELMGRAAGAGLCALR